MSPLARGWEILTRYPSLMAVPVLWELAAYWVMGRSLQPAQAHQVNVKLLLPPSLPSGAELIGKAPSVTFGSHAFVPGALLTAVLMVLGALVTAGYLHLLAGALQDESPSWNRFTEGVRRFGGRLFRWNLIVAAAILMLALLSRGMGQVTILLTLVFFVVALLYYLVEFLVVVEDVSLTEALLSAPGLLRSYMRDLFPIFAVSVGLSVALSLLLSATGLRTILLASPLWAVAGTWTALAVVVVVDDPPPQW